jgi:hypothetical protein
VKYNQERIRKRFLFSKKGKGIGFDLNFNEGNTTVTRGDIIHIAGEEPISFSNSGEEYVM